MERYKHHTHCPKCGKAVHYLCEVTVKARQIPCCRLGVTRNDTGTTISGTKRYCEACFHKLWRRVIGLDEY